MRRQIKAVLAVAVLAGLLPAGVHAVGDPCEAPTAAPLSFEPRTVIDRTRAGGEPVSIVAQDGSISVSAHAGTTHVYKDPAALPGAQDFAVGYTNQVLNWRSVDGGRSWQYVGTAGTNVGPHSATSSGFSDPDYAMDQAGTIYNVEINLANNAVFRSDDDGQSYNVANPQVVPGDRPWLAANEPGEVFLYVNLPKMLWRSNDGALTWSLVGQGGAIPISAKPYTDPRNPDDGLIGPVGNDEIAISADDGRTWDRFPGADLGASRQFFGALAVDRDGNAYLAAAGGYDGSNDRQANGEVTFAYFDRDREEWGPRVTIPTPPGDAMWPWLVAGDDGRVAVVWYQTLVDPETGVYDPTRFYAFAAQTVNGTGTDCDGDGAVDAQPVFSVANASVDPIHVGNICLSGTTCNASTSFQAGDRRLGDFFTVNFDKDGRLFVVSGDTTIPNPLGGPKPVGNPIFIPAAEGTTPMVEQPMQTRPTRCLGNLPLCGTAG